MPSKPVKKTVEESYNETFSGRVRALRSEANFSQPALSRVLGISTSYINLMESGERANPTIETVDRICAFFGVRREWLLDGTAPKFQEENAEAARERFYEALRAKVGPEEEREIREQQLMAEIAVRIAQAPLCADEDWASYRKQIIAAVDAYARRVRDPEVRLSILKLARASRDADSKRKR